jgi:Fe2+ transport system protein FeoA
MMRLSELRPGQAGKITRVNGDGPLGQRLMEMGVIEGTDVRVVRVAPLGDPMEIALHDYQLSLRVSEAAEVEVTP